MNMLLNSTAEDRGIANPDSLGFKELIMANMRTLPGRSHRKTIASAEIAETLGLNTRFFRRSSTALRVGKTKQIRLSVVEKDERVRVM